MLSRFILAAALLALLAARVFSQSTLYREWGDSPFDELGYSVTMLGDTDGDGCPDFAAGAPGGEAFAPNHAGFVRLFSGADGTTRFTIPSPTSKHFFAASISAAGDLDGDGQDDLFVGVKSSTSSTRGFAILYSGASGAQIRGFASGVGRDSFGSVVSGVGDTDGDGFPDLLVGASTADTAISDIGAAYLYSGKDGSILHLIHGSESGGNFGVSVRGAGDVDGDGFADLIIGANVQDGPAGGNAGWAGIYSGLGGGLIRAFDGPAVLSSFGFAVSRAGDLDGDGVEDQIVGAPGIFGQAGVATAFSGASGAPLFAFTQAIVGDQLGQSFAPAGDVDQDGFADVIVGAPNSPPGASAPGRAFLLAGPHGTIRLQVSGGPGDRLGQSVAGGFDLDQDGRLEFAAGAPTNSFQGQSAGMVKVFSVP